MSGLEHVADFLHQRYGFAQTESLLGPLTQAVEKRRRETGRDSDRDYFALLSGSPAECSLLIHEIIVPETFFFRYPESFAALTEWVGAIERRPLRILSFACSTGEEPYSIAMALLQKGWSPRDFHIEARDLNEASIARAKRGLYTANSFRTGRSEWQERFFEAHEAHWEVLPSLKSAVSFERANLLALEDVTAWDVIFCRNVLIYFSDRQQRSAIARLRTALADDGILFVGPAEPPLLLQQGWSSSPYAMSFSCLKVFNTAVPKAPALRYEAPKIKPVALPVVPKAVPASEPVEVQPPLERARDLADLGRTEEAQGLLRGIIRENPEALDAHLLMGLIAESAGQVAEAEASYRRVLFIDPSHREALQHMSLLLRGQGRHQAADQLSRRASQHASP